MEKSIANKEEALIKDMRGPQKITEDHSCRFSTRHGYEVQ